MLALAERRPWAMSGAELVAAFDEAHALKREAEAIVLRLVRQIDHERTASTVAASSAAVWYRNRHRPAIRTTHRWVQVARRVDRAPGVVGEAVASGAVNFDQADVITRALARIPGSVGVDVREQAAAELVRLSAELDWSRTAMGKARISVATT